MSESSIESDFKFISYKIGSFSFSMEKYTDLLLFKTNFNPEDIEFQVAIHPPLYMKSNQIYICGLSCRIFLNPSKLTVKAEKETKSNSSEVEKTDKQPTPLFLLSASIDGAFQTASKTQFPVELEETLVKQQAPTILFPFLRSCILSFFANAGFGSIMLPLVNINKIAQLQLDDLKLKVIE